jgi:hypothetical protein
MQQRDINSPLAFVTEAIAYFIAGSFVINVIAPKLFSEDLGSRMNQAVNWVTLAAGGFSILVAFLLVMTTIPYNKMARFVQFFERHRYWLLIILFPITIPQILPVILDSEYLLLSIVAWIFLIFILVAIGITSWKVLIKFTPKQFVALCVAFVVSAIIRLFQGVDNTELAVFLIAVLVLLILTLFNLSRKKGEAT